MKYKEKVAKWEAKEGKRITDPDMHYIDKLDSGLYTLQVFPSLLLRLILSSQNIVIVLVDVCVEMPSARAR